VKGIANRRTFELGLDALTNGVNDALKIRDDGPNLCGLSPYGIQPDQFATFMPRPTSCWTCVNASRVSAALGLGCLKIVPVCHGCFTSVHPELRLRVPAEAVARTLPTQTATGVRLRYRDSRQPLERFTGVLAAAIGVMASAR
jgi:hypothetical protein